MNRQLVIEEMTATSTWEATLIRSDGTQIHWESDTLRKILRRIAPDAGELFSGPALIVRSGIGAQGFYGSCGNAGCVHCLPLFDPNNHEIPGTEVMQDE